MPTVTLVSEATFKQSAEQVYDFVTNPANWVKTYPGSEHEEGLPKSKPLKVGDTWVERGPNNAHYSWQVSIAVRPSIWICTTFGRLGHDAEGKGGHEGRIHMQYRFLRPGGDITVFERTYMTETAKGAPSLPDIYYTSQNPVHAETYFANIARQLGSQDR